VPSIYPRINAKHGKKKKRGGGTETELKMIILIKGGEAALKY